METSESGKAEALLQMKNRPKNRLMEEGFHDTREKERERGGGVEGRLKHHSVKNSNLIASGGG